MHTNSFNRGLPVTSNAFNERLNAQCKTVSFGFRSVSNATSSFNMHRNSISTELWLTSKDLRQFPEQSNFTKRGFCVKSNVDIIFIQQFNSSNSGKYSIPAKEAIPRLEQSIFVAARPAGVTTTRLPFRRSLRYTPVPKISPEIGIGNHVLQIRRANNRIRRTVYPTFFNLTGNLPPH